MLSPAPVRSSMRSGKQMELGSCRACTPPARGKCGPHRAMGSGGNPGAHQDRRPRCGNAHGQTLPMSPLVLMTPLLRPLILTNPRRPQFCLGKLVCEVAVFHDMSHLRPFIGAGCVAVLTANLHDQNAVPQWNPHSALHSSHNLHLATAASCPSNELDIKGVTAFDKSSSRVTREPAC